MHRSSSHNAPTLAVFVMLCAMLAVSLTHAHVVLQDPVPRSSDSGLTESPCGGVTKGSSMASYDPGAEIVVTVNLVRQHTPTTFIYISFDNFETRTTLAVAQTPDSGIYEVPVTLPTGTQGHAVLQVIHQDYYSCADITVGEAPQFVINAGLNDAWYYPLTDGQGFFISVFPDLNLVSLAWFTYDTELPPEDVSANLGDPGHRWITALGTIDGNRVEMDIDITSGGLFDNPLEVRHTDPSGSDGTIILIFEGCNSATVEYDIISIGRQGIIPIQRIAQDNIALCEALGSE